MRWGPQTPIVTAKWASNDMVWIVLPKPISSAKIPAMGIIEENNFRTTAGYVRWPNTGKHTKHWCPAVCQSVARLGPCTGSGSHFRIMTMSYSVYNLVSQEYCIPLGGNTEGIECWYQVCWHLLLVGIYQPFILSNINDSPFSFRSCIVAIQFKPISWYSLRVCFSKKGAWILT